MSETNKKSKVEWCLGQSIQKNIDGTEKYSPVLYLVIKGINSYYAPHEIVGLLSNPLWHKSYHDPIVVETETSI